MQSNTLPLDVLIHHLLPHVDVVTFGKLLRCNKLMFQELDWKTSLIPLRNVLIGQFGRSRVVLESLIFVNSSSFPNQALERLVQLLTEKNPLPRVVLQSLKRQTSRLRATQQRFSNQLQSVATRIPSAQNLPQHFALAHMDQQDAGKKLERCELLERVLTPIAERQFGPLDSIHTQDDRRMFLSLSRTIYEFHEHTSEWHRTMGATQAWQAHVGVLTTLLDLLTKQHFPVCPTSLDILDMHEGDLITLVFQCYNPTATIRQSLLHLKDSNNPPPPGDYLVETTRLLSKIYKAFSTNGFLGKEWNVNWSTGKDCVSKFLQNTIRQAYRRHTDLLQFSSDCNCSTCPDQGVWKCFLRPILLPFLEHLIDRHDVKLNRNTLLKEFVPPLVAAGCKHDLRQAVDWINQVTIANGPVERRRRSSMIRMGFETPEEEGRLTHELLARHLRHVPRSYRGPTQSPDTFGIKIMLEAGLIEPREGLAYLTDFLSSWPRLSSQDSDPNFPASLEYFLLNSGVEDGSLASYLALGRELEQFAGFVEEPSPFSQWTLQKCMNRGYLVGVVTCLQRGCVFDETICDMMYDLSIDSQQKLWPTLLRTVSTKIWEKLCRGEQGQELASHYVLLQGIAAQNSNPEVLNDSKKVLSQAMGCLTCQTDEVDDDSIMLLDLVNICTEPLPSTRQDSLTMQFEPEWFDMDF